ncbi:MAG: ankyrin repeat domain-containing protein [Pseudobdellovibrionaceae bacterium]
MKTLKVLMVLSVGLFCALSQAQDPSAKEKVAATPAPPATQSTVSPASKAFDAVKFGRTEQLEELSKTIDLGTVRDSFGNTLLMDAASNGRMNVIKFLIGKNIDLNAKNENDETAIWMAMDNNQLPAFDALMAAGAKIDIPTKAEKDTLVIRAAAQNNFRVINRLMRKDKALANAQNAKGETALIAAAQFGNKDAIKSLLKFKADPTLKDNEGLTAYDRAKANNLTETMKLLEPKKSK